MNADTWSAIAAVATAFEALVVCFALWYAKNQIREAVRARSEAVRARSLDAFLAISEDIKKTTEARGFIYSEFGKISDDQKKIEHLAQMSDDQKKTVESVYVTLDRMGVLVKHGLIPKDVAFSMYFDVVLRTWHLVKPFIMQERDRRKSDLWMMYFEELNGLCEKHWQELLETHREEWKYMKSFNDIFHYNGEKNGKSILSQVRRRLDRPLHRGG